MPILGVQIVSQALSGQFEDVHTPSIQEEYFLQKYSVGQKSHS